MQQKIFAFLTVVMIAVSVLLAASAKLPELAPVQTVLRFGKPARVPEMLRPEELIADPPDLVNVSTGDEDDTDLSDSMRDRGAMWSSSTMVVGLPTTVPQVDSMPSLKTVPFDFNEAKRAFNAMTAKRAELLPEGSQVVPPLIRPKRDRSVVGRLPAMTIALAVDELAKSNLPSITGDKIIDYMDEHRLAIEAPIFFDDSRGYFLGTNVKAAFFPVDSPNATIVPEPLVSTAVRNLRVIGLVGDQSLGENAIGRTLLLEFFFAEANPLDPEEVKEQFELLFIHLLPTERDEGPEITAFATQKGRREIHEMITGSTSDDASLTASVKFNDFTLAGLYPANPVVTRVRLRSRSQMTTQDFLRQVNENSGNVSRTLDQMHKSPPSIVSSSSF